jgi:hypothetical protein
MPHGEHLIEELDEMEHKEMELIQTHKPNTMSKLT